MTAQEQAEAIRRAADLSVDHISAWFATGTGHSTFQAMREEIERNMTESLKFTEDCQSAFKNKRIAELEAMNRSLMSAQESMTKQPDAPDEITGYKKRIVELEAARKQDDETICELERTISDLSNGVASMAYVRDKQDKRIAELEELHIMQLAAISTASVQNTEVTIKDRIGPDHIYCTTAYLDVCRAVDREMKHRDRIAELEDILESRLVLDDATTELATELAIRNKTNLRLIEEATAANRRIAELEARATDSAIAYGLLFGKNEAMAALLDRLPHTQIELGTESGRIIFRCAPDCPACAWAKLKEGR